MVGWSRDRSSSDRARTLAAIEIDILVSCDFVRALSDAIRASGEGRGAPLDDDRIDVAENPESLSRFRLANQRIGFLRFAACADSQGVWHGGKVSGYGGR